MAAEAALQRKVIAWCKRHEMWCYKLHGSVFSRKGMPDLFILVPVYGQQYAVPLFVELKAPGKALTPLQIAIRGQLENAKAVVFCADNIAAVIRQITELQRPKYTTQQLKDV